jgi:hypothetical protein
MALPKKGLRTIEIGSIRYGWYIRKRPTYSQAAFESAMTIAIQELDCATPTVLHVTLNVSRPDNWIYEHQTQITPKVIKNIIECAQDSGWEYSGGGAAFEYEYNVIKDS